jgi:hypothetical protein
VSIIPILLMSCFPKTRQSRMHPTLSIFWPYKHCNVGVSDFVNAAVDFRLLQSEASDLVVALARLQNLITFLLHSQFH